MIPTEPTTTSTANGKASPQAQICAPRITLRQGAELMNVSLRTVQFACFLMRHGVPELIEAGERGNLSASMAAKLARLPHDEQRAVWKLATTDTPKPSAKRIREAVRLICGETRAIPGTSKTVVTFRQLWASASTAERRDMVRTCRDFLALEMARSGRDAVAAKYIENDDDDGENLDV